MSHTRTLHMGQVGKCYNLYENCFGKLRPFEICYYAFGSSFGWDLRKETWGFEGISSIWLGGIGFKYDYIIIY